MVGNRSWQEDVQKGNRSCQGSVLAKNPFMPRTCSWYDFVHGKIHERNTTIMGVSNSTYAISVLNKFMCLNTISDHYFTFSPAYFIFGLLLFSVLTSGILVFHDCNYDPGVFVIQFIRYGTTKLKSNHSQMLVFFFFSLLQSSFYITLCAPYTLFLHSMADNIFDFSHLFLFTKGRCASHSRENCNSACHKQV
jgi:hypothetical protein